MANEFVARKGLIVLSSGAKITGSLGVSGSINASGYNITANNFIGTSSVAQTALTASYISGGIALPNGLDVTGSLIISGAVTTTGSIFVSQAVSASSFTGSFKGDGSQLTGLVTDLRISGSSGSDTLSLLTDTLALSGSNGVTAVVTNNTITIGIPAGTVSASSQVDVRNTTGIATLATTGSNTFTGVQTINDTTNSTLYNNGALVVAGGAGFGKDVNISGSLNVTGLLTAVSMSTQYVTSSTYNIGVSKIILNDDDNVRFAGISINDSGSTAATASIFWDSQNHHFLYENLAGAGYNSALLIAGPKNTGSLGNELGLTTGRIPVASGTDHIDTNPSLTPLRVEGTTLHAEANVYVTGSVTASAFAGDGSNLTGIVTNLNITGSDGGTGTVSLKTQALTVDGTNGLTATVSGQTITISGSDATTTTKGVAQFNSTNFSVAGGTVTSNDITINGATVTLGGTRNITLQQITTQGATSSDQVTLNGGAIVHGVLFTSGSNTDVDTGTEVVATVATGSYDSAFFDYVVKKSTNYRVGTVMAVWDTAGNIEFTDTSTNDLGSTTDVSFTVDALAGNARLKATVTSDNWIVKTAVRAL